MSPRRPGPPPVRAGPPPARLLGMWNQSRGRMIRDRPPQFGPGVGGAAGRTFNGRDGTRNNGTDRRTADSGQGGGRQGGGRQGARGWDTPGRRWEERGNRASPDSDASAAASVPRTSLVFNCPPPPPLTLLLSLRPLPACLIPLATLARARHGCIDSGRSGGRFDG